MKVQVFQKSAGLARKCRTSRNVQAMQVLLVALLLAGCASHVEPEVCTVRVEVPVQVPCRTPDVAAPLWAAASLRKTDSLEVKVRALLAERRQRIGYEKELAAAAGACR
jgi:hypothetical protein